MNKPISVVRPTYLGRFQCVGGDCIEHCCANWGITVDKASYKRYRQVADPVLKPLLKTNLERIRQQPSDAAYAKFRLKSATGQCGLLDDGGLCAIQNRLGAQALCYTCASYPRSAALVGGVRQVAGIPSCPEIARLAILDEGGIEFEQVEVKPNSLLAKLRYSEQLRPNRPGAPDRYFEVINGFCMRLTCTRELPLWMRLVAMGMLLRQIDQRVEQVQCDSIPGLIETFTGWIGNGECERQLSALQVDYRQTMLRILFDISQARVYAGLKQGGTFLTLLGQAFEGLGMRAGEVDGQKTVAAEAALAAFSRAYRDYYRPVLGTEEQYLENYVLNYLFQQHFPFNGDGRLFESFQELAVKVGLLRFYLVGLAGYHRETFGRDHALRLIYSFCRSYEHSRQFIPSIRQKLVEQDAGTLGMMAVLAGLPPA
ncbi:MAG: flagellin lysine-N-methylase [Candidatus Competibacteraceae bacterium]|nr:flagellin lysine-N-methylase [Candidatus Competibacteraceae bacterium]